MKNHDLKTSVTWITLSNFCCHKLFLETYSSRWDGVARGKLPQCCGRDWCSGAQPDHRPAESPGLCAESVYEGQDDCLSVFLVYPYICMSCLDLMVSFKYDC